MLRCRKTENPQLLSRGNRRDNLAQATDFIRNTLRSHEKDYIVHYLHVTREDEFNYRRLYAGWLADALPKAQIGLSFEEFRLLVDNMLRVGELSE